MPSINVVRLMNWKTYKPHKKSPELEMCMAFSSKLRSIVLDGKLNGVFTHVPNEIGWSKNKVAQAIYAGAKAMGMIVGTSDYIFIGPHGGLALEAKTKTGTQNPGQKDFEVWCKEQGVPYHVFRSVDEGVDLLKKYGFIREKHDTGPQ